MLPVQSDRSPPLNMPVQIRRVDSWPSLVDLSNALTLA